MKTHGQKVNGAETPVHLWIQSSTDYWNNVMGMMSWNSTEKKNGNGKRWHAPVNLWKAVSSSLMSPETFVSFPKIMGEFSESMIRMQQQEMERMNQMRNQWMGKMESMERLMNLMVRRMFV